MVVAPVSTANKNGGGAQGFGLGWYERESEIAKREWDEFGGGGWVTDLVVAVVLVDFFFSWDWNVRETKREGDETRRRKRTLQMLETENCVKSLKELKDDEAYFCILRNKFNFSKIFLFTQ